MHCPRCGGTTSTSSLCFDCQAALTQAVTGALSSISSVTVGALTASTSGMAATIAPVAHTATLATVAAASTVAAIGDGPLAPGQAFGARYHIIRMLGAGGMGAVYHAWDAELGVSVAIKIIRPEIMANPSAGADVERRFKRELLLARQVTHTNVVRIHDLGEIDRIKYITMSYVEGADLAAIMARDGRLPVAMVVRIVRQVVSGLVAAHKAGIVHRDLKPAN